MLVVRENRILLSGELDDVNGRRLFFLPGNLEQDGLVCGRPDLVVKEVPAVLGQERLDRGKDNVQVLRASGQFSWRFRDINWWQLRREPLGHLGMSRGDGRCACGRTLFGSGSRFTEMKSQKQPKLIQF